jgi:type III restriction enzyme
MAQESKMLYEKLREEIGTKTISKKEIPSFVQRNLNPKFKLRAYQITAFQYFLSFWEEEHDLQKFPTHLLFQMATGSGKTMMMAGLILYLYEKGYRNFLFFVNSSTIIEKTKDNFMNPASSKYLFAPQIIINGKTINITTATNFEGTTGDDICIVFQTIQGLHTQLKNPQENSLTFDNFEDKKIVLIGDEAHHLSAETKKGQIFNIEDNSVPSWENTVMKILNSNKGNLLLDFTATAELRNQHVSDKYRDKLLVDYPLSAFRKDGYSKEVEIFKSDSEIMVRALQTVILSHYRKKLFADLGFDIKPVILFKSKNIEPSKDFMQKFIDFIAGLNISDIEHIKKTNTEGILKQAFDYFESKTLDLSDFIAELQVDFSQEKCISANDDKEKTKLQLQLNSLESRDNPIRAIFAVDKLNEGWDVLNLFDIVRLYETRDSGHGKIGKSTAAEAQLIGRGARYFPFVFGDFAKDKRKFDNDVSNIYRVCETMYYHSNNDSRYISEITQALIETGIIAEKTIQIKLGLKDSFVSSDIYKKGLIFLNEQTPFKPSVLELGAEVRKKIYYADLFSGKTTSSKVFKDYAESEENKGLNIEDNISKSVKVLKMRDLGVHIVRKALHQTKGLSFDMLQNKFQNLASLHEFIVSDNYLSNIEIHITGDKNQLVNIEQNDKLQIAKQVLNNLKIVENTEEQEYRGTKVFKAMPLRSIIKEKTVNYSISNEESGRAMSNPISSYYDKEILKAEWYAFTDCYGTSEEKALVKFMKAKYEELKTVYEEFYLVRNERHFAIYDFEQGRRFEPDFVLFLKKRQANSLANSFGEKNLQTDNSANFAQHYQIFIEPKGEHLAKEDRWKENFLMRLHDEALTEKIALDSSVQVNSFIEKFSEDDNFTIWGLPFYNDKDAKKFEFNEAFSTIMNS